MSRLGFADDELSQKESSHSLENENQPSNDNQNDDLEENEVQQE